MYWARRHAATPRHTSMRPVINGITTAAVLACQVAAVRLLSASSSLLSSQSAASGHVAGRPAQFPTRVQAARSRSATNREYAATATAVVTSNNGMTAIGRRGDDRIACLGGRHAVPETHHHVRAVGPIGADAGGGQLPGPVEGGPQQPVEVGGIGHVAQRDGP